MDTYTLTVDMSEDSESGILDSFIGTGIVIGFDGEEYHDDGTATGVYTLECDPDDLATIKRRLDNRTDVQSYMID